jgi:retron-type reverse transcriptase
VLDVDVRKYFDSIPHSHLREILDQRVTVRRMIDKWLNAGVLEEGNLHFANEGAPARRRHLTNIIEHFPAPCAGSVVRGCVRPRLKGKAILVRFADDFVMTFETYQDAKWVMEVLGKRLGRFGLKLHPDKTRFVEFRPQRHGGTPPDRKAQSFDFLGFTHSWGKSRKGAANNG